MRLQHPSPIPHPPSPGPQGLSVVCSADLGGGLAALQWGICGSPLRAFTRDGRETVLDSSTGRVLRNARFADEPVARVACRPQAGEFVFLTGGGKIGAPEEGIPALNDVRDLSWSPCGRYLAILRRAAVDVWNANRQKLVTLPAQIHGDGLIAWNPNPGDDEGLLAITANPGVVLWAAAGVMATRLLPSCAETTALAWDPAGRYIALAYSNGEVHIWCPGTNQSLGLRRAGRPIRRLLWGHGGAVLAGVSVTSLCIWNIQALIHGCKDSAWEQRRNSPITDVAFRDRGKVFAAGDVEGTLQLWRAGDRNPLRAEEFGSPITHLAWSASGKRLAVGMDSGKVCIVRVCK